MSVTLSECGRISGNSWIKVQGAQYICWWKSGKTDIFNIKIIGENAGNVSGELIRKKNYDIMVS